MPALEPRGCLSHLESFVSPLAPGLALKVRETSTIKFEFQNLFGKPVRVRLILGEGIVDSI
jgi:hypothetical protein